MLQAELGYLLGHWVRWYPLSPTQRQRRFLQSCHSRKSRPRAKQNISLGPLKGSTFNIVIFVPGALQSRRACCSDTRCAREVSSWDREDVSDISPGLPMTPTHATRGRTPGQKALERAPSTVGE